ncbi:MAG: hypothetical protein J6U04_07460 [Salinivirgaceae bacterium]|nr:hypothetical protein [Salinivirgaceae bacterium]
MRQLTKTLFDELKSGTLRPLLVYVQNDDTLDMEFRGNALTLYYRGGAILKVIEKSKDCYVWEGLVDEYYLGNKLEKYIVENYEDYLPKAKHLIDNHICTNDKNHLGEREIQQLVVKENNYSQNSNDTDYFIVDMEYEEGKKRFDLIVLRWDSNTVTRKKNEVSLAIIEVKQGIKSITSSYASPGLRKHQEDFKSFIEKKKKAKRNGIDVFCKDMLQIFKQKCELGLIKANNKIKKITQDFELQLKTHEIDFICLLANFKDKSRAIDIELIGMDECKFIKSSYMGYGLYASNIFTLLPKYPNMSGDYREAEKKRQVDLFEQHRTDLFGTAKKGGHWNITNDKGIVTQTVPNLDYILKPEDSIFNLYQGIRENTQKSAVTYFKAQNIAWWRQKEDGYYPTGHLVSSQIHCLNHLFALRTDKDSIKEIINEATKMQFDEILPSIIDNDSESFISFEFALDNDKLLREKDEDAKRGTMCTSIDAMILARKGDKKWLIPIEWKYTETYERKDKTNRKREDRYTHLIKKSNRLITPQDGIPHSVYFIEPNYELMRQTLLCEQLIANGYAYDFFHLNIIPKGNTELRNVVNNEFVPMLKDATKFKIIDPQELLSPLKDDKAYEGLFDYLSKRYWDAR